jgi:hypothetical protein
VNPSAPAIAAPAAIFFKCIVKLLCPASPLPPRRSILGIGLYYPPLLDGTGNVTTPSSNAYPLAADRKTRCVIDGRPLTMRGTKQPTVKIREAARLLSPSVRELDAFRLRGDLAARKVLGEGAV